MPRVTVLLPVYNAEKYLGAAINSILNQTLTDFELLIIDDGSNEATKKILHGLTDQRIRIITHVTNSGLIASLNEGLLEARGKYIARMDADDVSLPERLEMQVNWMEKNPGIAVCGTWIRDIEGKHDFTKVPLTHALIQASLLFSCVLAHPSVMLRREVFINEKLCYDNAYPHAEDYELWSRVARHHELANLPLALLEYRIHSEQVSQKYQLQQHASMKRCQQHQLDHLGLRYSDEDLELHCKFSLLQFDDSIHYAGRISEWLSRILHANQQRKIYDQHALRKVVGYWWYSFCAFQLDRKVGIKREVLRSAHTRSLLSPMQRLKMIYRLALR